MDNENLYTPSANNVLRIAQEQARFFKHQAVGTEHLLLALSLEKVGVAATVLHQFNVTSDDLREEIERYTGYGTMQNTASDAYLPNSPKLREILALAARLAQQMGARRVGTEHLLLALLSDETILSSRILLNLDVNQSKPAGCCYGVWGFLKRDGATAGKTNPIPNRRRGKGLRQPSISTAVI